MTPRVSVVGRIVQLPIFSQFRWRALLLGGLASILALLAFFPERYLATTSFTPSDRDSLGLGGTLGQLGAINSLFGNQAAVEVALRVGNSDAVRDEVIKNTRLKNRLTADGRQALQRYLTRKVEVRSLRGGIIVIEMQDRDAAWVREIVTAYQAAVQQELGEVSRRQTAYKRKVLEQLVQSSSDKLAEAQAAYDDFRLRNRYAEPREAIGAFGGRVPQLEAAIRAREVAIAKARELYTENNLTLRQMLAETDALRRQLAEAKSTNPTGDQGVGELVANSSRLYGLERELDVAKSLYNGYLRYLRGTAVEDLTADANLRVLELPHIETQRQIWLPPLALAIAVFLLWMAIEAYRLRPPPGGGVKKHDDD